MHTNERMKPCAIKLSWCAMRTKIIPCTVSNYENGIAAVLFIAYLWVSEDAATKELLK